MKTTVKMNFEDFLKTDTSSSIPQITVKEFVEKTRATLRKIEREYSLANQRRPVEDHEYEQQDCDNCKGHCVIKSNGKELECQRDKSEGECFALDFAYESFVDEIEKIMFHDNKYLFYELLEFEVVNETH